MSTIADARAELARAENDLKRMRASVAELEEEEKRKREEESEKRFQDAVPAITDALMEVLPGPLAIELDTACTCGKVHVDDHSGLNLRSVNCEDAVEERLVSSVGYTAVGPLHAAVRAVQDTSRYHRDGMNTKEFLKLMQLVVEYNICDDERVKLVEKALMEKVRAKTPECGGQCACHNCGSREGGTSVQSS